MQKMDRMGAIWIQSFERPHSQDSLAHNSQNKFAGRRRVRNPDKNSKRPGSKSHPENWRQNYIRLCPYTFVLFFVRFFALESFFFLCGWFKGTPRGKPCCHLDVQPEKRHTHTHIPLKTGAIQRSCSQHSEGAFHFPALSRDPKTTSGN